MSNEQSRTGFLPKFSIIQVTASALAAASAAFAASYLGVIGTAIGAALIGGLATLGTVVYEHSLQRTNVAFRKAAERSARRFEGIVATLPDQLSAAKPLTRLVPTKATDHVATSAAAARSLTEPTQPSRELAATVVAAEGSLFRRVVRPSSRSRQRQTSWPQWRVVSVVTATVFVTSMVTVIGVELMGGASLASLMNGERYDDQSQERPITTERPLMSAPRVTWEPAPQTPAVTPTPSQAPSGSSEPQPSRPTPSSSPTSEPTGAEPAGPTTSAPEPSSSPVRPPA